MLQILKTLWTTFARYRKHVIILIALAIISPFLEGIGINAIVPLMSFFMGGGGATDFINEIVKGLFSFLHIPFSFRYLLAFILVLFILRAISVIVFGYVRAWVTADFLGKESEDVMRRTLLSSWGFSLKQKIGTMHNTLVRDVQQTGALLGAMIQVIQSASGFLIYLIVAINISARMTFYALLGGAILLFVLRPLLRQAQRLGKETAGVEKKFTQFLSEHIIGMKSIKAAGVERSAISNGASHIHSLRDLSIRQSFMGTIATSLFQPTALVMVVVLFLLTYRTPEFHIVSFAASLYLIQKIFAYLESGQNSLQSVSALLPYTKSLASFKHELDAHRESGEGDQSFIFKEELEFNDVSFSYTEEKRILENINFKVKAGEIIGIIGPSGAGKTSIADLLLRLFKPQKGTITVDKIPSTSISLTEWRTHIGYVPQDVFLINDTIEENIKFYNKNITREEVIEAAKMANIYNFIMELPLGFETTTGDRGVMISGGQRQRIALARALASKPALLILDEATSALDHDSEKLIHEAISKLKGHVTVFIIAHRPSTIENADTIIVLTNGKIVEKGSPKELLTNPNSYFHKMQNGF